MINVIVVYVLYVIGIRFYLDLDLNLNVHILYIIFNVKTPYVFPRFLSFSCFEGGFG
jgi:hypothetical protein